MVFKNLKDSRMEKKEGKQSLGLAPDGIPLVK